MLHMVNKIPLAKIALRQSSPNKLVLLFLSAVFTVSMLVFPVVNAYGQGHTPGAVQKSLHYLSEVMDVCHDRFWVYEDVSSPCNHFHAYGKLPNESSPITIEGSWAQNPARGATALRIVYSGDGPYAGWYLMNGILHGTATAPTTNFGTVPNAGIDLTGAKKLVFWARSDTEGAQADFFMGGVGRDAETGCQRPDAPYPDSTPRIPAQGGGFTLHNSWTKYEIPLVRPITKSCIPTDLDLSYVLGGFGVVLTTPLTVYLDDIYYEFDSEHRSQRLEQPRFLRSFTTLPVQPNVTDGNKDNDIDLVLRSTAFSYDNAVTILAYLAEGSNDSLRRARLIGDAFVYAGNHDRTFMDGRARIAYGAGDIALPPGWEPKGIKGTTPVAGFYIEPEKFLEVQQQATDTGVNTWVGIALLALYNRTGEPRYLAQAKSIASFIYKNFLNTAGKYQGFLAGFQNPESTTPQLRMYASTEHNEDIIAFARRLWDLTGAPEHQFAAQHAKEFVNAMWDDSRHCFFAGTTNPSQRNEVTGQLPLDVHPWAVLAASEIFTEKPQVLDCPEQFHANTSSGFRGYDFNDDKDGVWFEGTAQMAVAYKMAENLSKWSSLLAVLETARNSPPTGDTFGLAAATPDGITTGFRETDETPIKYYRRLHIAATGWHVLAELGENPYYLSVDPNAPPVGTYKVFYRDNAGGCIPGGAGIVGNPYYCQTTPGPIRVNAVPGRYRVTVIQVNNRTNSGGGVKVWSGDASHGTQYNPGEVGDHVDFDHSFGEITLYFHDWYAADNPADAWALVRLELVPPDGTYKVFYRDNAGGCIPGGGMIVGNPYYCQTTPGPIRMSAVPGRYRVTVVQVNNRANSGGGVKVWSGDASHGTQYNPGEVGGHVDFDHSFGEITLYFHDWYAADNPADAWALVRLERIFTPHENVKRLRGDFNGDGRSDILWRHTDGRPVMLLMNGLEPSSLRELIGANTGWKTIYLGDFDGDGYSDIVWQHTNGSTGVWLMNGLNSIAGAVLLDGSAGWTVRETGDFNGDGKSDIVWQHTNGTTAVWLMNGLSPIAGGVLVDGSAGWTVRKIGDFNGDGKSDILWQHSNGTTAVWLMNGLNPIGGGVLLDGSAGWTVRGLGDFDGDGKSDILWQHANGTTAVWLMNGLNPIGGGVLLDGSAGWTLRGLGDFNGDGKSDIVWQHTNGTTMLWLMDGLKPAAGGGLLEGSLGWAVRQLGDFNSDGKSDIVWQHANGTTMLWLMNGLSVTAGGGLAVLGNGWEPGLVDSAIN